MDINNRRVKKAIEFLKKDQVKDGSWWGRWGICYIYGTTQTLIGLKAVDENMEEEYIKKAVDWLIKNQNDDGGWGEHYTSFFSTSFILGQSTVEHTSWAIIALLDSGIDPNSEAIRKGIDYILKAQKEDGSFPPSYTAAAIDPGKYEIYSAIFPLWALSKWYRTIRGDKYENS